ncbi:glycosyltransferase [uncultured Helicobacter sp.]|uniref:glycosyltransferase n=1 Tax=uncultured Helicobacter sp. TaxID=175537 RepID=UPI0026ECEBB9|nr:glycosyltransferase [uncultured Helicobacter sp.]
MKILICNLGIGGGGAERVLIDFLSYWLRESQIGGGDINPKSDIDLFLIEKKKQDTYLHWCEEHLHKVFTFPHIFGKVRFLNKFWKRRVLRNPTLINYFIKEQYDVNIGFLEGISTIYISQKQGGKKIGYIHIALNEMREGKRDKAELEAYLRLDSIICVSNYVKDSLLKLYPQLSHKHIEVIYNPIDKDGIMQKSLAHDIQKDNFVFMQVGRLTYQKGLITLLEANKILQDKGYNYEIWLLGEGERYKKELDSILAAQNVSNVRFLGFHSNPYPFMKICDVMVLASYFEGYGLVLAESCVLGKPIIASDIPTSKEILYNENLGECGMFFESKNAYALAQVMEAMYNAKDTREKFAAQALAHSQSFDVARSIKQLEGLLQG